MTLQGLLRQDFFTKFSEVQKALNPSPRVNPKFDTEYLASSTKPQVKGADP